MSAVESGADGRVSEVFILKIYSSQLGFANFWLLPDFFRPETELRVGFRKTIADFSTIVGLLPVPEPALVLMAALDADSSEPGVEFRSSYSEKPTVVAGPIAVVRCIVSRW